MKKTVFLDTNIILDFFLNREPFAEDAARILNRAVDKDIKAYISPITISNSYYILRKLAGHSKVISKLKLLLTVVSVTKMTKRTILAALESNFKDFEDALQSFAAVDYQSMDVLITRNTKDFKHCNIAVMTPSEFLKGIG